MKKKTITKNKAKYNEPVGWLRIYNKRNKII